MHGIVQFILLLIALAIGNVFYKLYLVKPPEVPGETWWGPTDQSKADTSIRPFSINIPDKTIEDLKFRLKNARPFTAPLSNIEQQYGFNTNLLKEVVDFWLNKYDWKQRQTFLNQYPQFLTNIQGLDIHYIHVRPKNVPSEVRIIPLLLLHGWPGSVREFYESIPLLTTVQKDKKFVFEVIIPSLPGYGFSSASSKPGLGYTQLAVIFKNLMTRLGHEKFYVQGGDWGSGIATYMSVFYPDRVKGIHLNLCISNGPITNLKLLIGSLWPSFVMEEKYAKKIYPLSKWFSNLLNEMGHLHLHATKPDTVGVALNDSPAGLAAYILEKFSTGTNENYRNRLDGGLQLKFDYNKLLDNVMIYWVTISITTSMRLYAESINNKQNILTSLVTVKVPTACAVFENELMTLPPSLFKETYTNLIQVNEFVGGHFAAFEVPQLLTKDVWDAVEKIENSEKK